ncbi:hypothetical protein [Bradyrhizobium sp. WSM1743]|uniref:hypothetical protein n=1 Tax=Bradyrhizobium sp. WSM1743 TaxID=318996 RepID=UPI000483890E|nr:hypothetical protein [Bradyrhizobium sp. WSM1743]
MRNAGHINVARSIFDHPMFDDGQPLSQREAWLWLIANAAWRPVKVMVRNGRSEQLVALERGQLTYSRAFLQKAWGWSSDKMVRTFLARLRQEGMVDLQTGQLQTIISICNYDVFQNGGAGDRPASGPVEGQQRASKGPEEENIKSIRTTSSSKNEPDGFDAWYSIYPRKKQRRDAAKAFAKLIASGSIAIDDLMAKTQAFAARWEREPPERRQFIPYPASWINSGEYADEPEGSGPGEASRALRDPSSFTDADWQRRLAHFREGNDWLDAWGPAPGSPGCLVPARLALSSVSDARGAA